MDNIKMDQPLHIDLDRHPIPEILPTTCQIRHATITAKTKRYLSIKKYRHRKANHPGKHVFRYVSLLVNSRYTFSNYTF